MNRDQYESFENNRIGGEGLRAMASGAAMSLATPAPKQRVADQICGEAERLEARLNSLAGSLAGLAERLGLPHIPQAGEVKPSDNTREPNGPFEYTLQRIAVAHRILDGLNYTYERLEQI